MKISENCFICGLNLYQLKTGIISCTERCTAIDNIFRITSLTFNKDRIYVSYDKPRNKWYYYQYFPETYCADYENPWFTIEGNMIPEVVEDSYALTEFLASYIPQINKVKAFL